MLASIATANKLRSSPVSPQAARRIYRGSYTVLLVCRSRTLFTARVLILQPIRPCTVTTD